jgi:hypothetical protein
MDFYGHGNESLGSIKAENFVTICINYHFFKEYSAPWSFSAWAKNIQRPKSTVTWLGKYKILEFNLSLPCGTKFLHMSNISTVW